MSKDNKLSFKKICDEFSIINVRWMVEEVISLNFFLVPKKNEQLYIENPMKVESNLEAVGFFAVEENLYSSDPNSYDDQIDIAFKGCVRQCMGKYGFFTDQVDFE